MIAEQDKKIIIEIADKYKISHLLLFGSSLDRGMEANDIDIAVEGLSESAFFKFYSELIFSLSKPVDLVDIGKKSRFRDMVIKEGVKL